MPKPICVKCKLFYTPKKNGYLFMEGKPVIGDENETIWMPYKLWHGDLWECRSCGHEAIYGTGQSPVAEDWMPHFEGLRKEAQERMGHELIQINDC